MFQEITAVVLAAGKGRRMGTALPKPLHPVAGEAMLSRTLSALRSAAGQTAAGQALQSADAQNLGGAGSGGGDGGPPFHLKEIRIAAPSDGARLMAPIAQKYKALLFEQGSDDPGTAGAVRAVRPQEISGDLLILSGDHPLIASRDILKIINLSQSEKAAAVIAVIERENAGEYGRVILDSHGYVKKIIEKEDAGGAGRGGGGAEGKALVNAGLYLIQREALQPLLPQIQKGGHGESNLTEIFSLLYQKEAGRGGARGGNAAAAGAAKGGGRRAAVKAGALPCPVSWRSAFGVNSQKELYMASLFLFERKREELMNGGVIFIDAGRSYVETAASAGPGTVIYPGAYLKGRTQIGSFCAIEPGVFIADSLIGSFSAIKAGSHIEGAAVGERSSIGPLARLRPGARIGTECKVGNFVEIKNSSLGSQTKASHLSYIGDSMIGPSVNIGAGAVTCNYGPDRKKRKTNIQEGAFIGSGAQLIAPLTVGAGAVIGAGSVIAKDVPEKNLAINRGEQRNIPRKNS